MKKKFKELSTSQKIKKIAKWVVNILNFTNAVLLVLIPIWNLPEVFELIGKTLIGISGVISAYLIGNTITKKEN
jgi:hypothetical protein